MSKIWQRLGLIILIILCLWNITTKLIHKVSFNDAIASAKAQIQIVKNNISK